MANEIKPEQVPDEVVAALVNALYDNRVDVAWSDARAGIAAALNAWPGMKLENLCSWVMDGPDLPYVEEMPHIILPLPQQEKQDG